MSDKLIIGNIEIPYMCVDSLKEGELILAKDGALFDAAFILKRIEQERDRYKDLLYRLVIKKDGTARIEAEALLKGER